MYMLATGIGVSTSGFQSFPWYAWLLIGMPRMDHSKECNLADNAVPTGGTYIFTATGTITR
jgi:hypothetical protein